MTGDAVGLISPLCGNGMAMAIHSAKMLSDIVLKHWMSPNNWREEVEKQYQQQWNKMFVSRLWAGRKIQQLFGREALTEGCMNLIRVIRPAGKWLVSLTHGKPF